MQSEMFKAVKDMNTAFGNPEGKPATFTTGDYNFSEWERLEKQCKNIKSEFVELMDAIEDRDVIGVRDALCDINVFSLGAHHLMGHDADADMLEVVAAVMTRFCTDPGHYAATCDHYIGLGVDFYTEGVYPRVCLKSSHDQGMTKDKDGGETWEYPKGKFLKALGYRQPVFKETTPPFDLTWGQAHAVSEREQALIDVIEKLKDHPVSRGLVEGMLGHD